jgi:threonine aldolase
VTLQPIDLRSDTVTRPTQAMRDTMANAEVGDDVYGEDPSVNRLQETAARLLGKESALFVPSGTMGNQVCIAALTRPGDVMLACTDAHVLLYEGSAPAALWGVQINPIGRAGRFSRADVLAAIAPDDAHYGPTRLLAVENTHTRSGGTVVPLDEVLETTGAARDRGLALHLDGARLFNAAAATQTPADRWAEAFDTVTICLSKGLGAPVGSVVAGSAELIDRAHRARKRLGGGMRQSGILAAAGLYALENHVERLADDHANAQRLAHGLAELGFNVKRAPETNMVLFRVEQTRQFSVALRERSLLINPMGAHEYRAVTHLDVSESDIDDALGRVGEVVAAGIR